MDKHIEKVRQEGSERYIKRRQLISLDVYDFW
jgi:hypothetical protein